MVACLCKPTALKNIQSDMHYIFLKCLFVEGSSGSDGWAQVSIYVLGWSKFTNYWTIIRLRLFLNANCSLDWNLHSILYASGFQTEGCDSRGSVPSKVCKCAVPTDHLCSEISFLCSSNSPDLILYIYHNLCKAWNALLPLCLYGCATACRLEQTFA